MLKKHRLFKRMAIASIFIVLLAIFLLPNFCFAQGVDVGTEYADELGLQNQDVRVVAARIIRIFLGFLAIIAVALFIYGGWLWMTSSGNDDKINQAKAVLKNTIIGLIIIASSYAIVTFIINMLSDSGSGGLRDGGGSGGGPGGGVGALGDCIVESIYPEPSQAEVPRNTGILVTFREEIDASTMCSDDNNDGVYCNCSSGVCDQILTENVRIFQNNQAAACSDQDQSLCLEAYGVTSDGKTFVFSPVKYLGSPSENIWHTVYLSNSITKTSGENAFSECYSDFLTWSFEVSNKLDLTPPQIKAGGVFPFPDNEQDDIGTEVNAIQAAASVRVITQPQVYSPAQASNPVSQGGSESVGLSGNFNCTQSGQINVAIDASNVVSASGIQGVVSGDDASDGIASIGCGLSLVAEDGSLDAGNSWVLNVIAEKQADTITLGNKIFTFGQDIESNPDNNVTAANIALILSEESLVDASAAFSLVTILAAQAGDEGNLINLEVSNPNSLEIDSFTGGSDAETVSTVKGKSDKPRNAIIQINFNEAINPITVSGPSEQVSDYIRVIDTSNNGIIAGEFLISNQYKTIEFKSNNECGVNSCGEKIYCLPENSHLKVELIASNLSPCNDNADCVNKSPFNICGTNNTCQDIQGNNYPAANIFALDGVVDLAFNSLDANRDEEAKGPLNFYNENIGDIDLGDNYVWSFYISDKIDTDPPQITDTYPGNGSGNVSLFDPVSISFDKLMMSTRLKTGSVSVSNGMNTIEHKLINIWNYSTEPIGYWVSSENKELGVPDGEVDWTEVYINHTMFSDMSNFRAQIGSGLLDIYQNCYKPCSSATCSANPSCCSEVPTNSSVCQ